MEERADHGRLYSHIKHIEMKNAIADIKAQEGSLNQHKDTVSQVNDILKAQTSSFQEDAEAFQIDETFGLPYGIGYDSVIKAKADIVNN